MDEIDTENNNKIFYFKSLKENIIRQNEYLTFLLHNIYEIESDIDLLLGIGEKEFDYKYKFSNDGIMHLKCKMEDNKQLLVMIDSKLNTICEHNVIEDYIEGGIEQEMIKIKYCGICSITL